MPKSRYLYGHEFILRRSHRYLLLSAFARLLFDTYTAAIAHAFLGRVFDFTRSIAVAVAIVLNRHDPPSSSQITILYYTYVIGPVLESIPPFGSLFNYRDLDLLD